ncbi:MAG: hypothetical protein ACRDHD_07060 [Candidatus Limnocylindria bacterium]
MPIVFLFAHNISEQISLDPLLEPLGLSLLGAGILLAGLALPAWLLRRAPERAALLATLLIGLFFAYGHVWNAVGELLGSHRPLFLACGVVALVGGFAALRAPRRAVSNATAGLNVIGVVLLVLNGVPVADHQLRVAAAVAARASPNPSAPEVLQAPERDVWYLVFDRYAGQPALSGIYGYDNSPFLDALRTRGFYVAEESTANYLKTAHSLASTLALDYLDPEALGREAVAPGDWTPLYRALQESYPLQRVLSDAGYAYLHLGLRRGPTFTNSEADQEFIYTGQTEFSATLADTTMLIGLERLLPAAGSGFEPGGTSGLYGLQTLYQLERLEEIARMGGGRKYVFAHLLLPHPPYLFNADGSWATPEQARARTPHQNYVQQLEFANARILRLLDILLDGPRETWPIIVIQADEGPFPERYERNEFAFRWLEATPAELLQKFSILNAILLPDATPEAAGLHPRITSVNTFRVVLNAEFGADLPLLPDRNWVFPHQRDLYDLTDVTDRVPRSP